VGPFRTGLLAVVIPDEAISGGIHYFSTFANVLSRNSDKVYCDRHEALSRVSLLPHVLDGILKPSGYCSSVTSGGIREDMYCPKKILNSLHCCAPIGISLVEGQVVKFVNLEMSHITGYTGDELVGMEVQALWGCPKTSAKSDGYSSLMIDNIGPSRVETQWLAKDGRTIDVLLCTGNLDGLPIQEWTTLMVLDITKQKEAERETAKIISSLGRVISERTQWLNENNNKLQWEVENRREIEKQLRRSRAELQNTIKQLQKTQAQIIQSEKMASIGQLAAGVAHEINNPVAFVNSNLNTMSQYQVQVADILKKSLKIIKALGNGGNSNPVPDTLTAAVAEVQYLAEEIDLEFLYEDFPQLIEESLEGAVRIRQIVSDLKDFAHPGEQALVSADINQGLETTINIVWNEIKYKARLIRDYGDIPHVICYPQQLNQVFMNLLVNAAQAIEKDGEIVVKTRHADDNVIVQISDDGCGIPEDIQPKIFDPFFTTKEIGKGTGLGLNMAYNIIKKHNGRIEVASSTGNGTTFTIILPENGVEA
jgi:two-component system NtrC family sensor kinase